MIKEQIVTNVKKDKYDVLASVINALYDQNQEVKVETVNLDVNKAKNYAWYNTDLNNPQIPTKQGSYKIGGPYSPNHTHAQSIKIGKISMRGIPLDNGYKYIVRTPEGEEAEFSARDKYFERVWQAALMKYDMPVVNGEKGRPGDMETYVMSVLRWHLRDNPKLKAAADKGIIHKDKKSAFEKAKEKAKAFGVSDKEFDERLAMIKRRREHHN